MKRLFSVFVLLVALGATGCGGGGYGGGSVTGPPVVITTPSSGAVTSLSTATLAGAAGFINPSGMTVYVFDADLATPNASTCTGACSANWPSVVAATGAAFPANWSSFVRADGTSQLAYKTRALYTYVGDAAAGQTNGDGLNQFGGVWHIARP